MVLEAGKTYRVTVEIQVTDDVNESVLDEAIATALFDTNVAEAVDVGTYEEEYQPESFSMQEFYKVISIVQKLRQKEETIKERFENSTEELKECFHWMLKCALDDNSNHCCLTLNTCPSLYAKALSNMGFDVQEIRNVFDTLAGHDVYWKKVKEEQEG